MSVFRSLRVLAGGQRHLRDAVYLAEKRLDTPPLQRELVRDLVEHTGEGLPHYLRACTSTQMPPAGRKVMDGNGITTRSPRHLIRKRWAMVTRISTASI
jgi:hypothetical protein